MVINTNDQSLFKGMHAIFQKKGKKGQNNNKKGQKRAKYLKIWAKMYKI